MLSTRKEMIRSISNVLGDRSLYWFGTRGEDASSLSDIPQFQGAFSFINRYARHPLKYSIALEDITGIRIDLDDWDIDDHLYDEDTKIFRHALFPAMHAPSAIIPYRPYHFLSAIIFARQDKCDSLGLYVGQQRVFEHKPWVESAIARMGIPTLGWKYIADDEQTTAYELLSRGDVVVRPNRGSGGQGIVRVSDADTLSSQWPEGEEFFASVSLYIPDSLPINIGGVVWDDGVTLHFPSAQLIGIQSCIDRPFGYCGNDFALPLLLERDVIRQLDDYSMRIGDWLQKNAYRGAFGVDYMLFGDKLLFTEINARFQGSTRTSCMLSVERDEPCLLLDHLAAMLHLRVPMRPKLEDMIKSTPAISHVVVHNTLGKRCKADVRQLSECLHEVDDTRRMEVSISPDLICDVDAVATCFTVRRGVTKTGFDIDGAISAAINDSAILNAS